MVKYTSSVLIITTVIVTGAALILSSQPQNIAKEVLGLVQTGTQAETKEVTWAGHPFEIGKLSTLQYPTSGNAGIQFTDKGFYASSYSLPRSKLLDVDMNQKIKIKVTGNFEGQLYNMSTVNAGCGENINYYGAKCLTTEAYHFSEICIYLVDSRGTKYGIRCLGTRHNIMQGNTREHFKFDWFIVENTGKGIIFEDSSGVKLDLTNDTKTAHSILSLDKTDTWRLRINSHVNGEGWSRLEINEIEIVK
ncbi:MAG: hypothetical protein HY051_01525 [Candidatus Aenigmarchaeota archaeon]|nr:hypothetical protein [Candidatus Aenigmarchaeota archaeon]